MGKIGISEIFASKLFITAVISAAAIWPARAEYEEYYYRADLDQEIALMVLDKGYTKFDLTYDNLTNHTYRVECGWFTGGGYAQVNIRLSDAMSGGDDYSIAFAVTEGNTRSDALDAGLVFKIEAPEKKFFSGGTVSFDTRHIMSYEASTGSNSNWRAATFEEEPEYVWHDTYHRRVRVKDDNALDRAWYTEYSGHYYEKLTLAIPAGKPSFFIAIWNRRVNMSGMGAWSTIRLNAIELNDVVLWPPSGTYFKIY